MSLLGKIGNFLEKLDATAETVAAQQRDKLGLASADGAGARSSRRPSASLPPFHPGATGAPGGASSQFADGTAAPDTPGPTAISVGTPLVSGAAAASDDKDQRIHALTAQLNDALAQLAKERKRASQLASEAESLRARQAGYEAQIGEAYREMTEYRQQASELREQLASVDVGVFDKMQEETAVLKARLSSLQADFDASKAAHASAISAARSEVQRAEMAAEAAAAEVTTARRAFLKREEELTSEVAELSSALTAAQRANAERESSLSLSSSGIGGRSGALGQTSQQHSEAEAASTIAGLNAQLSAANASAASATASNATLRQEVDRLRGELSLTNASCEGLRKQLATLGAEKDASIADLQSRVGSLSAQVQTSSVAVLEGRVASLVATLSSRTAALERSHSEASALRREVEVEKAGRAAAAAEASSLKQQLATLKEQPQQDNNSSSGSERGGRGQAGKRGGLFGSDEDDDTIEVDEADDDDASNQDIGMSSSGSNTGGDAPAHTAVTLLSNALSTPPPKGSRGVHDSAPLNVNQYIGKPPTNAASRASGVVAAYGIGVGVNRQQATAATAGAGGGSSRLGALTPLTKIRPIARNEQMRAAANVLDVATYKALRMLSGNPMARLGFFAYFALLHLWALVLLVFHTHGLPHEAHAHVPKTASPFAGGPPVTPFGGK